ncbi:FAD-binding domain-containing protein [Apiospora kogelbergensis]|uniref:FAD-binding domain-containing protein n=1 Tax=Apiospora kogelbergensis TaxID=1337665 RepID=UPI00312EEEDB
MKSLLLIAVCVLVVKASGYNFPFESDQLVPADTEAFPAIAFGNAADAHPIQDLHGCRAFPGSPSWPPPEEWRELNGSLGGALLNPMPPGAVCYSNSEYYNQNACNDILANARSSRFYIDDPVSEMTTWTEGRTCSARNNPPGNCTQGGFPVYVVNATTVRHVQIAVNFARNKSLRLVVKNTGHDWIGRSVGAGSLSIWTHHLKDFEFVPKYEHRGFQGMAAKVSSGIESWEMFSFMKLHNMTLVVPSDSTVGAYGGWMTGGGHSPIASLYGLGADQPLSLQVVTADGRFVTANSETNADLYYALRGGGPGTYGIVTSAVVNAYPYLSFNSVSITFTTPGNGTLDAFWSAFAAENQFGKQVTEKPHYGSGYSYVSGSNSTGHYSYTTTYEFPDKSFAEITALIAPHIDELARLGISIAVPQPIVSTRWADASQGRGDVPGNQVFASRLFSTRDWEDPSTYADVVAALRYSVEAGYQFHGIHLAPDERAAAAYGSGPPDNAVSAAWRRATMHADLFDKSMARWRAASPDAGAYVNEADLLEPHWQDAFWGADKYPGLVAIKRKYDPRDLFWAPTSVGSEGWAVQTDDFLPSQNGRLCKVSHA